MHIFTRYSAEDTAGKATIAVSIQTLTPTSNMTNCVRGSFRGRLQSAMLLTAEPKAKEPTRPMSKYSTQQTATLRRTARRTVGTAASTEPSAATRSCSTGNNAKTIEKEKASVAAYIITSPTEPLNAGGFSPQPISPVQPCAQIIAHLTMKKIEEMIMAQTPNFEIQALSPMVGLNVRGSAAQTIIVSRTMVLPLLRISSSPCALGSTSKRKATVTSKSNSLAVQM
mmetsp:Transcript_14795/g.40589  ORF Transcript_14795/g.40589 Transcript_14795/m.40589 type:complete len:226 (+) Transcript_14795:459-1136(+)